MSGAKSLFGTGFWCIAASCDATGITRSRGSAGDGLLGVLWKSGDRHQQSGDRCKAVRIRPLGDPPTAMS